MCKTTRPGHGLRNLAAELRHALPPVDSRHCAALTEPDKVARLLRDLAGYRGHPVTRAALQLSPLLLRLRPDELRAAERLGIAGRSWPAPCRTRRDGPASA